MSLDGARIGAGTDTVPGVNGPEREEPALSIGALIECSTAEPADDHWSDAQVLRLSGSPFGDMYLKSAPVDAWYPLRDEAARLEWVAGRVPSPRWWKFDVNGGRERLLTAAVPGRSLKSRSGELSPSLQVELQATALRTVHSSLPVEQCPFTLSTQWLCELSERLHKAGQIGAEYLAEVTGGWTIRQAFAFLESHPRPDGLDDVVLHGDPYAGNLIVQSGRTVTWALVDWGWCGVGDRWHDLANVYVYIERKLGRDWAEAFLSAYGIEPDEDALTFFRVLDGLR